MAAAKYDKRRAKWKKGEKDRLSVKVIIFGSSLFLLQVVVIYYLTSKLIAPITSGKQVAIASEMNAPVAEVFSKGFDPKDSETTTLGSDVNDAGEENLYVIKDLIINPARTNGTRFLLTTIGFRMSNKEAFSEMETKNVQVRDILNTILTRKTIDQLVSVGLRDSLKAEIEHGVHKVVRNGKLLNVYFSKFIIQ